MSIKNGHITFSIQGTSQVELVETKTNKTFVVELNDTTQVQLFQDWLVEYRSGSFDICHRGESVQNSCVRIQAIENPYTFKLYTQRIGENGMEEDVHNLNIEMISGEIKLSFGKDNVGESIRRLSNLREELEGRYNVCNGAMTANQRGDIKYKQLCKEINKALEVLGEMIAFQIRKEESQNKEIEVAIKEKNGILELEEGAS